MKEVTYISFACDSASTSAAVLLLHFFCLCLARRLNKENARFHKGYIHVVDEKHTQKSSKILAAAVHDVIDRKNSIVCFLYVDT